LQEGMLAARASLGDRWQDCYFSAPIWRFNLSPGLAGAAPMTGVMMSSVDRVGRQFPLTLVSPQADGSAPILQHILSIPAFESLEGVALDALEDSMTRDTLAERLGAITLDPVLPAITVTEAQGGLVVTGPGNGALVPQLLAALTAPRFRKPSVWSADIDGATRLMICEGLPAGGQMTGLFDMDAAVWQPREDA
jgi:type VI secretion system protein ImpM